MLKIIVIGTDKTIRKVKLNEFFEISIVIL
jgi:hypothetical protein